MKRGTMLAAMALWGCSGGQDGGSGSLTVLLEAEDTILEGLEPGMASEQIRDGWQIRFDQYVVVIGDIDVHLSADPGVSAAARDRYAVDLAQIAAAGLPLWTLTQLQPGEWAFHYRTALASDGAGRHATVPGDDFDALSAAGASHLLAGRLRKTDGRSCPPAALATPPADATVVGQNDGGDDCYAAPEVSFRWLAPSETRFGPCEVDDQPGFSVAADTTRSVAITIHGDHLFFNGFPEGGEGGVVRLAQWLADCDLDVDGEVTQAELEAIAPADLHELDDRYQLGGAPLTPLDSMWTYLQAQLKTQGHFQGEGECPFDGH